MREDRSYKELVIDKITKEYEEFKSQQLAQEKTKEDVFNSSYENYVKTELYFLFMNHDTEFTESLYYAIAQEKENVLHGMYEYYSEDENAGLNSLGQSKEFVEKYCSRMYSDIMNEFESRQNGAMLQS